MQILHMYNSVNCYALGPELHENIARYTHRIFCGHKMEDVATQITGELRFTEYLNKIQCVQKYRTF